MYALQMSGLTLPLSANNNKTTDNVERCVSHNVILKYKQTWRPANLAQTPDIVRSELR